MDFLRNIKLSLQATGPAAVLCVEVICITLLGILGNGPIASGSMACLSVALGATFFALGKE